LVYLAAIAPGGDGVRITQATGLTAQLTLVEPDPTPAESVATLSVQSQVTETGLDPSLHPEKGILPVIG
jgi:hypothetical protein